MATMQAPSPFFIVQAQSGTTYTADAAGVIANVVNNDINSLNNLGCDVIGTGGPTLIGRQLGINMNVTTDQQISMFNQGLPFRITKISVKNASAALTTAAAGGVYPAASKGGTAIVAATQVYTALSASNLALDLTIVAGPGTTEYVSTQSVFLSLTTANGSAATADVFIYGDLGQ